MDTPGSTSPVSHSLITNEEKDEQGKADLLNYINDNVIGKDAVFIGPYGRRKVVYCDYTASGKSLKFIEDFIEHNVYPFYANTHTTSSVTGLQTSKFREDARSIIHKCVNGSDKDHVIFTGSGVTACVHKLMHALSMKGEEAKRTVVIVGPYEHHSNILPWRESGAQTDRVKETFHGTVDLTDLEEKLKKYSSQRDKRIIVAMSAASNVTGIKTDTVAVAEMIHKYGGLSIWDYAAGAPYLNIDMNPSENGYKDAVLISPHKFVGGPGTPGVLVAKRHVFQNEVPGNCGGGTVLFVTRETHKYLKKIEEREEGGTPAIIESIRAGLTFQLKQSVGAQYIESKEEQLVIRAFRAWRKNKNLLMLGSRTAPRIPIFSFLIRIQETGKLLHHHFAATLLNDLYGVQARSGCACAGPYAQDLLEMDEETAQKYAWLLSDGNDPEDHENNNKMPELHSLEIMKPGFTRLNLPFFFDDSTIDFVLHAVDMVATHGWKLLPWYRFNSHTGTWRHRDAMEGCRAQSLNNISYSLGKLSLDNDESDVWESGQIDLDEVARKATIRFKDAERAVKTLELPGENFTLPEKWEKFIWFLQPKQALQYLKMPALKLIASTYSPLPFRARNNTLARAKEGWQRAVLKVGEQIKENDSLGSSEESLQGENEHDEKSEASGTNLKPESAAVHDEGSNTDMQTESSSVNGDTPGTEIKPKPSAVKSEVKNGKTKEKIHKQPKEKQKGKSSSKKKTCTLL